MTRARCCSMSRPRSLWAATVWLIWPWSVPSRRCSVGRLGSDGVTAVRDPGRRHRRRGAGDPERSGAGSGRACGPVAGRWPGRPGRRDGGQVIVDIDATLVTAHSEKEGAEPTYKRGVRVRADVRVRRPRRARHRGDPRGRPAAREGLTVDTADHIACLGRVAGAAARVRARPGAGPRRHRRVRRRRSCTASPTLGLEYSIGFAAHETVKAAIEAIPEQAWRAAVDGDGDPRDGAQVAELTAWMPAPTNDLQSPAQRLAGRDAGHRPPRTAPSRRGSCG